MRQRREKLKQKQEKMRVQWHVYLNALSLPDLIIIKNTVCFTVTQKVNGTIRAV